MPFKIFVSYSHRDSVHREKLAVHLAPLVRDGLSVFYDGRITPGADLDAEIRRELRDASIFVALASPDYLQSEYCFIKEYGYARRRAARKTMFVVAVILRPCGWKGTRMARYKSLPRDGKEVTRWANRDAAFEDVVNGLRRVMADAEAAKETAVDRPALRSRRVKPLVKRTTSKTPLVKGQCPVKTPGRRITRKAKAPRSAARAPAPTKPAKRRGT